MEDYREIGPPGNGKTRKTGASNLAAVRETTRPVRIHASRVIFRGAHYNILLKDFAYFQFTWESKSAWRLAYFPNPWITGVVNAEEKLVEWEGLTELGLLANDDVDEFVAELPYLGSVPPVRFEFSLIQYREVSHPAAHMHIGHHADNRWPFARLLDPLTFAMMLTKFYYPTVWNAQSQYANGTGRCPYLC